jgi:hypothetical protein
LIHRSVSVGFHPRVAAGGPRLPIGRFRHVGRPRAPRACALLFTCPRLQQSREAATAGASHVTLRQRRSAPRERRSGRDRRARRGGRHASPGGCRAPRHVSTVCVRSHSHRCSAVGASDVPPPPPLPDRVRGLVSYRSNNTVCRVLHRSAPGNSFPAPDGYEKASDSTGCPSNLFLLIRNQIRAGLLMMILMRRRPPRSRRTAT